RSDQAAAANRRAFGHPVDGVPPELGVVTMIVLPPAREFARPGLGDAAGESHRTAFSVAADCNHRKRAHRRREDGRQIGLGAKLNCPPVMHRPPPRLATQLSIHCWCFSERASREMLLRMMQSKADSSATVSGKPRSPAAKLAFCARCRFVAPGKV